MEQAQEAADRVGAAALEAEILRTGEADGT